jgi:hypothetical protein
MHLPGLAITGSCVRDKFRHNHADSSWLRASSDMLSRASSCLLIARVAPLRNSCSISEANFIDVRFHLIVFRYFAVRI